MCNLNGIFCEVLFRKFRGDNAHVMTEQILPEQSMENNA